MLDVKLSFDEVQSDHVDRMIESWARSAPGTDVSVLGVTGRMLRAAQLLERALEAELREHRLSLADFDVLNTVRREAGPEGINPRKLATGSLITSGAVTARLDRLERAGLIARSSDPDDRRAVRVKLTKKGRTVAERALRIVLDADARFLEPLGARDADVLARTLKRLLLHHER